MAKLNLLEAVNRALLEEMERDDRVFVLGEDVGAFGGAFKATAGLYERFGRRRVIDTPMCEYGVIGLAIGAGLQGLRPVVEIQFADFISTGFDPIVQYAATTHWRWGAPIPIVIRAPWGGGNRAGPFHSQCPEAWFAHVPGLKVVIPSNPHDAKGLLIAAIRDPNPVIFFEPKYLYRRERVDVPDGPFEVPIGLAERRRSGNDATIIAYGAMVPEAVQAADALSREGIECDVIDLRTVSPFDREAVASSVRRTGRLAIVHEARRSFSVGSEIAAFASEECFWDLDVPPLRITAPDTPVPHSPPLEDRYRPAAARIVDEVRKLVRT